jgi:hypothetical protein
MQLSFSQGNHGAMFAKFLAIREVAQFMMRQEVGCHEHHERLRLSISTLAKVSCIGKIFTEKFVHIL